MVEIMSDPQRVTGLETVIRLHRRYRGVVPPEIRKKVTQMRRLRREGLPGKVPSPAQRLDHIGFGMEWEAQARKGREKAQRYSGSEDQTRHRLGQNLPTAPNGAREREQQ